MTLRSVRRAADDAIDEHRRKVGGFREITPRNLAMWAERAFVKIGGVPAGWHRRPEWLSAFRYVINGCRHRVWDPRAFVNAQIQGPGRWGVEVKKGKAWKMQPGLFTSAKASERFEQRLRAGIRDEGIAAEADLRKLRDAEREFAEKFMDCDGSARVVEATVRKRHLTWSLDETEDMPHVRLPALADALDEIDAHLAERLPEPPMGWTWADERRRARRWLERDRRERLGGERNAEMSGKGEEDEPLDPELGEML